MGLNLGILLQSLTGGNLEFRNRKILLQAEDQPTLDGREQVIATLFKRLPYSPNASKGFNLSIESLATVDLFI